MCDYELIDFGDGRKLESLGGYVIDRPSPAASDFSRKLPAVWRGADAYFDVHQRQWLFAKPWPPDKFLQASLPSGGKFRLPFRPTAFGHIGAFPEQQANWQWLGNVAAGLQNQSAELNTLRGLNLFAHTGGSTLALATSGCAVAHVDAAKPSVMVARENAAACGLEKLAIRYIVDDAVKFASRELRRGRIYDVVVMDPPAYGHSPAGKAWRIERDLETLIDVVLQLLHPTRGALLITGHTAGIEHQAVAAHLRRHSRFNAPSAHLRMDCGRSQLPDRSGRQLDAGFYVRATYGPSSHLL